MAEKLPEHKLHDPVHESILQNQLGFLQYSVVERLHKDVYHCPVLEEEGNPKFYKIKTVKRVGFNFDLDGIVKLYDSPRVSRCMDDVRSENDAKTKSLVNDNQYILKVYDHSIYCTIYEHYLYNLEEVCQLQKAWGTNVRPNLGKDVISLVKKNGLVMQTDNRPTIFFRDLMQRTLKFLEFLHLRKYAYGGLHPHNIVVVDEECTIKFRGLKGIADIRGYKQDAADFVRLVRFCAHGGGRDINDVSNGFIWKEAQDFLVIFDCQHGNLDPIWKYYANGFIKNRLNIGKHPLFWDDSMCLNYFLQTHALLSVCNLTHKTYPSNSQISTFQNSLDTRIADIKKDLQALQAQVQSTNTQDPKLVINGIITRIRNIEGHFPDGLEGVTGCLGKLGRHPTDFWKNLRARFPGLITAVHRVMLGYTNELSPLFSDHWEKFYPYVGALR